MAVHLVIPILIRGALALGSLLGLGYGAKKYTEHSEYSYFNNGVCKKCGGHFKFIEGTEQKGSKGYQCDVCDNCVWIDFGADSNYIYIPSKNARK